MFQRKKSASAEPFRVPSIADLDDTYAKVVAKITELRREAGQLDAERSKLSRRITEAKARGINPLLAEGVAEIVSSTGAGVEHTAYVADLSRLRDVRARLDLLNASIKVLEDDERKRKDGSRRLVLEAVREEFRSRMTDFCSALKALDDAHAPLAQLWSDLEDEGVSADAYGVQRPFFLGSALEPGRHAAKYIRDARTAGLYVESK